MSFLFPGSAGSQGLAIQRGQILQNHAINIARRFAIAKAAGDPNRTPSEGLLQRLQGPIQGSPQDILGGGSGLGGFQPLAPPPGTAGTPTGVAPSPLSTAKVTQSGSPGSAGGGSGSQGTAGITNPQPPLVLASEVNAPPTTTARPAVGRSSASTKLRQFLSGF